MKVRVYQYPKCSTCRKALAFLDRKGVEYESIDITTKPPSKRELQQALTLAEVPFKKLFNTSGQSYRDGNFGEKLKTLTQAQALDALAKDGKLIKRPLVFGDGFALVGFDEKAYAKRFGAR